MASAVSRLGKARRAINRRQRTANMVGQAASTIGAVATFAHGQAKKADTAWSEYEEGYKAAGGDDFKRPKFGESGWLRSTFKGPEGEVSIGEGKDRRTYNIENLRKAGSFLGSESAQTVLTQKQRDDYLGRTAPGKVDPLRDKLKSPLTQMTGVTDTGFGTGNVRKFKMEGGASAFVDPLTFGRKEVKQFGKDFLEGYQAQLNEFGSNITIEAAQETDRIKASQRQGIDPTMDYSSLIGSGLSGEKFDKMKIDRQVKYAEDMYEPIDVKGLRNISETGYSPFAKSKMQDTLDSVPKDLPFKEYELSTSERERYDKSPASSQTAVQVSRYNQILSQNPSISKEDAWKIAGGK